MIVQIERRHTSAGYKIFCGFLAFMFLFSVVLPPQPASAQSLAPTTVLNLPTPGAMVPLSAGFTPALMTGVTIDPDNPLRFDFIMDRGQSDLTGEPLKEEYTRIIKYFMASLTVPEDELWVNLSPYEKDRMIAEGLGKTEMGRDMLAQDYLLKQLTASLMYPEKELGQKFWDRVYQKAREQFGTTEIPMNTFNKVWIVPDEALVYEQGASAFVVKSRLAVMLDSDYLAMNQGTGDRVQGTEELNPEPRTLNPEIIREVIIPEIEKEVNEGKNFANLRQIYNALILATWYKQRLKDSLLGKVYVNQNKTKGIDTQDKQINQKIYDQYIESFKKGVYNFIKEDLDPATQEVIPRKYFSGGMAWKMGTLKVLGAFALGTLLSFGTPDVGNASSLATAAMAGNKDGVTTEFVDNADAGDIGTAIVVKEGVPPLLVAQAGQVAGGEKDLAPSMKDLMEMAEKAYSAEVFEAVIKEIVKREDPKNPWHVDFFKKLYKEELQKTGLLTTDMGAGKRRVLVKAIGETGRESEIPFLKEIGTDSLFIPSKEADIFVRHAALQAITRIKERLDLELKEKLKGKGPTSSSTLNFPDATVRIEGAPVDPVGVKFEGDVYIYNHSGQPIGLNEQAGQFFPKTLEGKPLVKDAVIVIKPEGDAARAASPIVSSPTGRKLTNVVLALATAGMICLGGCGQGPTTPPESPPPITKVFDTNLAIQWMDAQINPATNLIRSFQDLPFRDPSYGVTWSFNQAQAIEGFLAGGQISKARQLADGLLALQNADGSWFNAYETETGSVATNIGEQSGRWVGPNVAVGRALLDVTEATGDGQYAEAARKLPGWLDQFFVDRGSYGYLTAGAGASWWTSTEHNMRAMALYDRLGDRARADLIATWINTKMFAGDHYYVGYSSGETVNTDPTMAIDVQFLGPLMALHGGRDPQAFVGGIEWLLKHQTEIVYDNQHIFGIPRWLNVGDSIWFEGTAGLAGALEVLGRNDEADKFLFSISVVQGSQGGVQAAIGGTPGWPGTFPYNSPEAVGPSIAVIEEDPRHLAKPLAAAENEPSSPETESRLESPEPASSPISGQRRLIGAITALSLLWGTIVPSANALEMSLWKKFDEPTERARMINEIALGIIHLGDEQTGLAPSHVGHPGFERLKFLYDAAVDALVLKAAGKQKDAEKILDYFADRLAIPVGEVAPYADTNGIAGILKVWKTDSFNVRGLVNALDRTSTKPRGQGMLEYYSTPGPMAFVVMAFLNVNKERYLPVAVELGNALLSLQRPDGGLKDGDRSPNRVHIEPHMDSFATFIQLYQATNDKKWKTAAEKAWQFFIKSDAYHPEDGIIWQGIWEFGTNKVFATDAYSWTMAGPGGDRMSLFELEKSTETMLSKSLTSVTLELPDGKTRTVVLVDFTDPKDPQTIKEREGFHPMGTVEWAGGVIAALQKNAVRFWEKGNPQQKEKARHYKALAEYLIANSLYAFYEIPGLEGLLSFYATGQNVQTGHGWRTPFFYVKGPGVTIKGGSLVSAWPVLPIQGLNPFERQDPYKKFYDAIPVSGEDKERAIQFVALSVVNRSFKEAVPTRGPDAAAQIVEPGNYNSQMWDAFVRGDYKKSIEWAQKVVNDPAWIHLARRDQEQKVKEIGGLVRYPWGTPPSSVPELETAIWRYPLLNEIAAAMWGLAAANFELGNRGEAKKWMRRIIEEVPYHQIFAPDGPGYWNALISWEYNPGNVRRDAQMGVLYREVLREMGRSSAAPKEISMEGRKLSPSAPSLEEKPRGHENLSQPAPLPKKSQQTNEENIKVNREIMSYLEQLEIADPAAAKRSQAFQAIVNRGRSAEKTLVRVIQNHELQGDPLKWAAFLLGVVGSYDVAKPVLENVIANSSYPWFVQIEAKNGLKILEERYQKQVPQKKSLKKEEPKVDEAVLSYLKDLTIPDPIAAKRSEPFLAIAAMGRKAESTLVKVIKNRELEGDPLKWAAFLLGVVGSYEVAKPVLESVIGDPSYPWYVREEAKNGLQILLRRKAAGQAGLKEDDLKSRESAEAVMPSTSASSPVEETIDEGRRTRDERQAAKDVGGIDLNPALLDLQIKRDGNGVPLPLPQQPIETMRIDGFVPIIINITPIPNLPQFLGLDLPSQEDEPTRLSYQQLSFAVTTGKQHFSAHDSEKITIDFNPLI